MKRNYWVGTLAAIIVLASATHSFAALSFDGQSGVFLNPLAYTIKASGIETSAHTVDLDALGSVQTYNLAFGLKGNVELGFTKYASNVTGVKDQNVFAGKWQFMPESKTSPALALRAVQRTLVDGPSDTEFGISATKIVSVGKNPLVLDLGVRSTKSLGFGLFGVGSDRHTLFEGSAAFFVTKNFAVGTEFKQQIDARAWHDIAFRYVASPNLNLDFGIANFNNALDNQVAFALTYSR